MRGNRSFDSYLEHLCEAVGHSDRRSGLMGYCQGLMLPIERKSIEPLAAHLEPSRVGARHQALHHFVAQSEWSDAAVLAQVRRWVLPHMDPRGGVYWIVDDTGFPKKGTHSVGVARQYCGQLGKQDNCQVAVSLSVATEQASLPVAYDLYLPQPWADDQMRRRRAGVPEEIEFATKPQIALRQLRAVRQSGAPDGVALADAGYGDETAFRDGLTELGLTYAVGIRSVTTVWPPGREPLPPKPWSGQGRKPTLLRRDAGHQPMSVKALALQLEPKRFRTVHWREGTNKMLASRFAAVRVRAAHRDYWRGKLRETEWLLI
ncbi:MAG TPA: IS701 family transposase, partial [Candidatus Dormibacteraeota bacterium]|nr:IS701 family transposase [Candidatus Dormibacteraeota bacterium]